MNYYFPAFVTIGLFVAGLLVYALFGLALSFVLAAVINAIAGPFGLPMLAWWQVWGALIVVGTAWRFIAGGSK